MTWLPVSCVVVHHRNLDQLPETLRAIEEQGIEPAQTVVVDNSGDVLEDWQLSEVIDPAIRLERVPNRGYGSAANHGTKLLLEQDDPPEFILIATHEVRPGSNAVNRLVGALASDRRRMAVGPRLTSALPDGELRQSCGGVRSGFLGVPRHRLWDGRDKGTRECEWLDGSFILYRTGFLEQNKFREEFFLYYEECELHLRLAASPGAVVCVADAVVEEEARGVPPYLRGRNLQWLVQLHGAPSQRALAVPWLLSKLAVKVLLGRSGADQLRQMVSGWLFARTHPVEP